MCKNHVDMQFNMPDVDHRPHILHFCHISKPFQTVRYRGYLSFRVTYWNTYRWNDMICFKITHNEKGGTWKEMKQGRPQSSLHDSLLLIYTILLICMYLTCPIIIVFLIYLRVLQVYITLALILLYIFTPDKIISANTFKIQTANRRQMCPLSHIQFIICFI